MTRRLSRLVTWTAALAAFGTGFFWMKSLFESKKIPYPFEWFGTAVGLGLACWTAAAAKLLFFYWFRRTAAVSQEQPKEAVQ